MDGKGDGVGLSREKTVGRVMNAAALAVAVLALLLQFASPGPAGPPGSAGADGADGPEGVAGLACWDLDQDGAPDIPSEDANGDLAVGVLDCRGPRGPGALVVSDGEIAVVAVNDTCTEFPGLRVTVDAPGPGLVVLHGTVVVRIQHAYGVPDNTWVNLAASGGCAFSAYSSVISVPAAAATGEYYVTAPMQRTYALSGPASVTYGVNGISEAGSVDYFFQGSLAAVFYPS